MKNVLFSLILTAFSVQIATAQHPAVTDFYKHYEAEKDVHSIDIDAGVFKLITWVTSWESQDKDVQALNRIAENLKGMNIVVVPKQLNGHYTFKDVQKQVQKDDFDQLMNIREEGNHISFYAQGKEKSLRDMIIFIDEKETYSIISVKGALNLEDLQFLAANHSNFN